MAEKDKTFYWIKLRKEFMDGETIDFLMSQKNGANYVVLYQMLIMKTINTEGQLCNKIGEVIIPFDAEKIQRDCKWFDIDTVRVAMELYAKLGLIYKNENNIFMIANFEDMVGSETYWAKQKRIQREKESVGQIPTNVQNTLISNISNLKSNSIINIYEYWNSKDIIKHQQLTDETKKAIEKALKTYKEEEIKEYIDRYNKVLKDKDWYFDTKWTLAEFLKQRNGISNFTDEGSKWINYLKHYEKSTPNCKPQQNDDYVNVDISYIGKYGETVFDVYPRKKGQTEWTEEDKERILKEKGGKRWIH